MSFGIAPHSVDNRMQVLPDVIALHACEANVSPRSDFTWRSHISLAKDKFP